MRIVRKPVLKENKKILISMIIISAFMLIISVVNFIVLFGNGRFGFSITSVGQSTSIMASVLPTIFSVVSISWGVSAALLLKTKKAVFAKMPSYVICALLAMAFIIYYIASGEENIVQKVLIFSVVILAAYPHIIATLTLEGRMYNRVFATIFTSILIAISLIIPILECVLQNQFGLTSLFFTLSYIELLLIVLAYDLEKPKNKEQTSNKITH